MAKQNREMNFLKQSVPMVKHHFIDLCCGTPCYTKHRSNNRGVTRGTDHILDGLFGGGPTEPEGSELENFEVRSLESRASKLES